METVPRVLIIETADALVANSNQLFFLTDTVLASFTIKALHELADSFSVVSGDKTGRAKRAACEKTLEQLHFLSHCCCHVKPLLACSLTIANI